MSRLIEGVPLRGLVLLAVCAALLVVAPFFASNYLLSVLIIVLYFAYVGQAWNLMIGFAGLLSLGHALVRRHRRLCQRGLVHPFRHRAVARRVRRHRRCRCWSAA